MTKWKLLPILFIFLIISCGVDETPIGPEETGDLLHYDGENHSAPRYQAGVNVAAIYFPSAVMRNWESRTLSEVRFYLAQVPDDLVLRVHRGSEDGGPGIIAYEQNLTNELGPTQWISHDLSEALTLEREDLWITITFTDDEGGNFMGCDEGPQAIFGAYLLPSTTLEWETYFLDINWNIRGVLAD